MYRTLLEFYLYLHMELHLNSHCNIDCAAYTSMNGTQISITALADLIRQTFVAVVYRFAAAWHIDDTKDVSHQPTRSLLTKWILLTSFVCDLRQLGTLMTQWM
jgi:hypothetical protein